MIVYYTHPRTGDIASGILSDIQGKNGIILTKYEGTVFIGVSTLYYSHDEAIKADAYASVLHLFKHLNNWGIECNEFVRQNRHIPNKPSS